LDYNPGMTLDMRPGLDPRRLIRLLNAAIERCQLDLAGLTVLTEAASGAYVVTPVLAAMAGANVYALAGATAYATSEEIQRLTVDLARSGMVMDRVQLVCRKDPDTVGVADIVTNSGQVRPIDAAMVAHMKPSSVIPLMYESWEYRAADVDLEACRTRGILVAGTNERHPAVDVFSFLGQMAVMQLHHAGIAVRGSQLLLLCDNDFAPFIAQDLRNSGADVTEARQLTTDSLTSHCDAVIVAQHPRQTPVFTATDAAVVSHHAPGAVVVQYWGDVDRAALVAARVPVWPPDPPRPGHMAVLPSAVGPEPIVRLQSGGLKVGQVLARGLDNASAEDRAFVQLL
jgi:hypothetical protein